MKNNPVFENGTVIVHANKEIGEVYPCAIGWGYHHYKSDLGYEGADSKKEATEELIKENRQWKRNTNPETVNIQ